MQTRSAAAFKAAGMRPCPIAGPSEAYRGPFPKYRSKCSASFLKAKIVCRDGPVSQLCSESGSVTRSTSFPKPISRSTRTTVSL